MFSYMSTKECVMAYIVYGKGGMRHLKIVWLLREMSLPHEVVPMSHRPDSPEYKQLLEMNPFGKWIRSISGNQEPFLITWSTSTQSILWRHAQVPLNELSTTDGFFSHILIWRNPFGLSPGIRWFFLSIFAVKKQRMQLDLIG